MYFISEVYLGAVYKKKVKKKNENIARSVMYAVLQFKLLSHKHNLKSETHLGHTPWTANSQRGTHGLIIFHLFELFHQSTFPHFRQLILKLASD